MVQRPLQMGLADHYTLVPLVSPDEMFHAAITELLAEWARSYGPHLQIGLLVGKLLSPRTHELRDLLARNGLPIGFHDADSGEGRRILNEASVDGAALPVLVLWSGLAMREPFRRRGGRRHLWRRQTRLDHPRRGGHRRRPSRARGRRVGGLGGRSTSLQPTNSV